jgi:hypothetical protein
MNGIDINDFTSAIKAAHRPDGTNYETNYLTTILVLIENITYVPDEWSITDDEFLMRWNHDTIQFSIGIQENQPTLFELIDLSEIEKAQSDGIDLKDYWSHFKKSRIDAYTIPTLHELSSELIDLCVQSISNTDVLRLPVMNR